MLHLPTYDELRAANRLTQRVGTILDLAQLRGELGRAVADLCGCDRATIVDADDEVYPLHSTSVGTMLTSDKTAAIALQMNGALMGWLLIDNSASGKPLTSQQRASAQSLTSAASTALANARRHSQTVSQLATRNDELNILTQIDRELTETISLRYVFQMSIDWAQRFTNGTASSLTLYDPDRDELVCVDQLGYNQTPEQMTELRLAYGGGIEQRAARTGKVEMIPDVNSEPDYVPLSPAIRSHLSIPVRRNDRIIAVISVESRKLNAFTDAHVHFIQMLAVRAGVAMDNARLFNEATREREKLSHILIGIADGVIVVGLDGRLVMLNDSAAAALGLYARRDFIGKRFDDVIDHPELRKVYQSGTTAGSLVAEAILTDGRTYYVNASALSTVGVIIVMRDINSLKAIDQMKSDLLATVSHDLKQPLTVISSYVQLLQMHSILDEKAHHYLNALSRAIVNMTQLINDLLDIAQIEAGQLTLDRRPLRIIDVLGDCLRDFGQIASAKAITLHLHPDGTTPMIDGDTRRLEQVFTNLVSNAIKYSPPEGHVNISVESHDGLSVCVHIKDNGIGISPEDQARVFDRFYRVRRVETENIEGTGMGLAIVKRLVEAHDGQIGLTSRLGEGSTFTVCLPAAKAVT